jgi:sulfate adenylyltransferase large subunit
VGSVDDGKSTLIGRLLFDSRSIFEDQLAALERASRTRGRTFDLSLLTDGLRAEREQGITIDVAYRYFATPSRTFVIADTPGHYEFTRNMATGASLADVAVVLVDASRGLVEQARRHATIASILGVPQLVVCVNKMDLVGFEAGPFEAIRSEFDAFAAGLDGATGVAYIPISALHGDNVVLRSERMPWYRGPSLLEYLEQVPIGRRDALDALRLPVQLVLDPGDVEGARSDRLYAGRIEAGEVSRGDLVHSMDTGEPARVRRIRASGAETDHASAGLSVAVELDPDPNSRRGDVLAVEPLPTVATRLTAWVCWLVERPLHAGSAWSVKHVTRTVRATCASVDEVLDVNSHRRVRTPDRVGLNEIARVEFTLEVPLYVDPYRASRATGSFIVIDDETHDTAGAGMIEVAGASA